MCGRVVGPVVLVPNRLYLLIAPDHFVPLKDLVKGRIGRKQVADFFRVDHAHLSIWLNESELECSQALMANDWTVQRRGGKVTICHLNYIYPRLIDMSMDQYKDIEPWSGSDCITSWYSPYVCALRHFFGQFWCVRKSRTELRESDSFMIV